MKLPRSSAFRTAGLVLLSSSLAASVALIMGSTSGTGAQSVPGAPPGQVAVTTHVGHIGPGRIVHAQTSSRPFVPTRAEAAQHARLVALHDSLKAPLSPRHTTKASVRGNPGPETPAPSHAVSPTAFDVLRHSNIPASCAGSCAQSTVNEPDTAAAGADILQTSNWDIADSTNGGKTWVYQNPYSLSSGFCCDQTVLFQPNRNRFFYEGLNSGGFVIGEAAAKSPSTWCTYQFTPASFGGGGTILDYPKIAYSNNFLYVTWNLYNGNPWVNSGLARLPLDQLDSCSTVNYNYLTRNDTFTFGLTGPTSSLDTFYWVSNWYTSSAGTSGSDLRIFYWPENSGTYFFVDRAINAYNFSIAACGSPDGTITNWCSRDDPRWETPWISRAEYRAQANSAFAGDSVLGVAISAGPSSFDTNDYVVYEYFKLNALTYIGNDQTYNTTLAFTYAGCGVNEQGYTGCIESYGGGSSDDHPATFLLLQDNISPTQPWGFDFVSAGAGNATAWGDYMVAQPYQPEIGAFIGTGWVVNSGGAVVPTVYVWGRGNDSNGYSNWK
jgi:hypothetical protein